MKSKNKNRISRISNEELARYSNSLSLHIETLVTDLGFKLFKAWFTNENQINYLRITITHPDKKISLDDCELVSKTINKELDKLDQIPFPYTLEVQSPGSDEEDLTKDSFSFTLKDFNLVVKA